MNWLANPSARPHRRTRPPGSRRATPWPAVPNQAAPARSTASDVTGRPASASLPSGRSRRPSEIRRPAVQSAHPQPAGHVFAKRGDNPPRQPVRRPQRNGRPTLHPESAIRRGPDPQRPVTRRRQRGNDPVLQHITRRLRLGHGAPGPRRFRPPPLVPIQSVPSPSSASAITPLWDSPSRVVTASMRRGRRHGQPTADRAHPQVSLTIEAERAHAVGRQAVIGGDRQQRSPSRSRASPLADVPTQTSPPGVGSNSRMLEASTAPLRQRSSPHAVLEPADIPVGPAEPHRPSGPPASAMTEEKLDGSSAGRRLDHRTPVPAHHFRPLIMNHTPSGPTASCSPIPAKPARSAVLPLVQPFRRADPKPAIGRLGQRQHRVARQSRPVSCTSKWPSFQRARPPPAVPAHSRPPHPRTGR
jgi:hypothetical protein